MKPKRQKVKVEDLRIGPIRHHTLSTEVLDRVDWLYNGPIKIAKWLGLREEFEVALMRDSDPLQETLIWSRIALAWEKYHQLYLNCEIQNDAEERRLVGLLILISCGNDKSDNEGDMQGWDRLLECWNNPTPPIEDGQHRHGN